MLGTHADADDARRDAAQYRKAVEQRHGPRRGDRLVGIEERVDDTALYADLNRLELPDGLYTGIWWYARFPNHYQGDSSGATAARGEATTRAAATRIANAIRAIKRDEIGPQLQKEFFEKTSRPTATPQR